MMTLSLYKQKKIIDKWVKGGQVKTIAREEKVCAETVRRCLEKNKDKTGYKRGKSSNKRRDNEHVHSRFLAGEFSSDTQLRSKESSMNENMNSGFSRQNNSDDVKKMMMGSENLNLNSDVDQICSILEKMQKQEDSVVTTLTDHINFDEIDSNQTMLIKQLMQEIHTINTELSEVKQQITEMQSTRKKNEI